MNKEISIDGQSLTIKQIVETAFNREITIKISEEAKEKINI